jgi:hypothetical protein
MKAMIIFAGHTLFVSRLVGSFNGLRYEATPEIRLILAEYIVSRSTRQLCRIRGVALTSHLNVVFGPPNISFFLFIDAALV